jgi:serine/threonine protein kinase
MGIVYKARQTGLNRIVALKMIFGGSHVEERQRGRFCAEAQAVAKLRHPGIVSVYDVGVCDGLPYISREYLEGGSLDEKIDGKPLPPRNAALLVEQLARAVQFAHSNGIVHRDLKPGNVLFGADSGALRAASSSDSFGRDSAAFVAKIGDLGLAKDWQSESGLSGSEAIMGTPSFMSPEQAEGRTSEIGAASDIHALGAILYFALTGRPPYLGAEPMATILQVRTTEPVPPSRWQPTVPRDLELICLKCLEKTPARRYATAGDLADDLRRFLDGAPVHARPATFLERLWKWVRRRPTTASETCE